jgi:hypothetical protein
MLQRMQEELVELRAIADEKEHLLERIQRLTAMYDSVAAPRPKRAREELDGTFLEPRPAPVVVASDAAQGAGPEPRIGAPAAAEVVSALHAHASAMLQVHLFHSFLLCPCLIIKYGRALLTLVVPICEVQ